MKIKWPNTSHFINTQELSRLSKISFDTRMKEAQKNLISQNDVSNALDLGDANTKK